MAKVIKKAVKKAQRGSVSCPRFKSEGPGFRERLRNRIQEGVENREARREERRSSRKETPAVPSFRGALGKPEDRPLALDYTTPSRERRAFDIMGGNTQAKKGKKVSKYKAGGKIKASVKKIVKKSIVKSKIKSKK